MAKLALAFIWLSVFSTVSLVMTQGASAQDVSSAQTLSSAKKPVADVRVIIDVSGSMKQNDPNDLRRPALELLVKLLPENSKAGVWTFGKYINMLVPHREVNAAWRQDALSKGKEINSAGLFTNIGEALEKAAYDLDGIDGTDKTSIILLTDGVVDIDREAEVNQREWRRIVDEVLPRLKNAGYTIHTIALSDNADSELLNKLAIGTDGIAAVANTADELMKIFLAAFDNAAPAEQVPLRDSTFVVDSSVEEFTALIFTQPGSASARVLSPDQTEYSVAVEDRYLNWYRADQYDLVTLTKPIEGEWQVIADLDPDSRITVVSNLNLVVKPLKNNLFKDQSVTVSALLSEGGKTITRTNFLNLLDIQYTLVRQSDQQQWQGSLSAAGAPVDGIYTTELNYFEREDDYQLHILVDGKSFTREFTHTFSIRQPFSVSTEKQGGGGHHKITVSYSGSDVDLQRTQVAARIKDPQDRNTIQPFQMQDNDTWSFDFIPEFEGGYQFALRINAHNKTGEDFEVSLEPFVINYPDSGNPFNQASAIEPKSELSTIKEPEPQITSERDPVGPDNQLNAQSAAQPNAQPNAQPDVLVAPDPTKVDEVTDSKLLLYIGLGAGNIVILLLAYLAYRMIMGNKQDPELEELEQAVEDLDKEVNTDAEAVRETPPPVMADVDSSGSESVPEMMATDLDIGVEEDNSTQNADELPAMHGEEDDEDSKSNADLGVTDVEFSLDDFSSDDTDDHE